MSISTRKLRQQAHHLKPVVIIGNNGLTDAVQHEIDMALTAHELIKVRLNAPDSETKQQYVDTICAANNARCVQVIGHVLTVYRENPEKHKS